MDKRSTTPAPDGPRPGAPVEVLAAAPRTLFTMSEAEEVLQLMLDALATSRSAMETWRPDGTDGQKQRTRAAEASWLEVCKWIYRRTES